LERSTPIILLIEDDEFDRTTLTRMLEESGYRVITADRAKAGIDTFAINHHRVALVLASTGLADAERIRLVQTLYRIDQYVPIVTAPRRASHRPNSGEDPGRHAAFAALITEVERRLHIAFAQAAAQAESFAQVQAPAPEAASSRVASARYLLPPYVEEAATGGGVDSEDLAADQAGQEGVFFPDVPNIAWSGSSRLMHHANLDPRSYLRQRSSARRSRRRRIGRIGMAVVAACCAPLIVPPLLEMRTTIAKAVAEEGPPPKTLASASMSARIGIVPLISSAHVKQRPSVAHDLRRTPPAKPKAEDDDAASRTQPRRSGKSGRR
jgi:CheY-like chemotaxis protein